MLSSTMKKNGSRWKGLSSGNPSSERYPVHQARQRPISANSTLHSHDDRWPSVGSNEEQSSIIIIVSKFRRLAKSFYQRKFRSKRRVVALNLFVRTPNFGGSSTVSESGEERRNFGWPMTLRCANETQRFLEC